jgi:2-keto-3-deoxygluconate permease
MIMKFMKKIPAGMMIVPLLLGCLINTFFPDALKIGGVTTALFSKAGSSTALGMLLFCMGTKLQLKEMPSVIKRGGILLLSKFVIAAALGITVGKIFGPQGFWGLSILAIIIAVSNSNGSIYFALMTEYGDEKDCACMPILAINDGPFLTLIALGASGLANIPIKALLAAIIPIVVGMILGNIDKSFKDFFGAASGILIPFNGFSLGAGISLIDVIKGGPTGILLAFLTVFIGGGFIVLCDKFITRRPGYAGWAAATTAGSAVAVPAMVGSAVPALQPFVSTATVQVAASTVLSAIMVPFIVGWWAKKYGCPRYPLVNMKEETTEKATE